MGPRSRLKRSSWPSSTPGTRGGGVDATHDRQRRPRRTGPACELRCCAWSSGGPRGRSSGKRGRVRTSSGLLVMSGYQHRRGGAAPTAARRPPRSQPRRQECVGHGDRSGRGYGSPTRNCTPSKRATVHNGVITTSPATKNQTANLPRSMSMCKDARDRPRLWSNALTAATVRRRVMRDKQTRPRPARQRQTGA